MRFGRALLARQWGRIGIQGRIRLASDWNGWRHPGNLPDDRAAPAAAIPDQAALTRIRFERNKWRYCRLVPFGLFQWFSNDGNGQHNSYGSALGRVDRQHRPRLPSDGIVEI